MIGVADIANAVVVELNALHPSGTFNQAFTAVRSYLPEYKLTDMNVLHVTVVPKGVAVELVSRSVCQYDFSVDVAVQQKLTGVGAAQIDPMMALTDQVEGFFRLRRLTACPQAMWVRTDRPFIYSQEHLKDFLQFTGVMTLTFRVTQ